MTDQTDKNATEIWPDDVNEGYRFDGTRSRKDHYNRLRNGNRPGRSELFEDRNAQTKQDRRNILDAIAGQLELTDYQKKRAKYLLEKVSDDHFRGRCVPVVILCICGHVGREDGRDYHPNCLLGSGGEFAEVAKDLDVSLERFTKCWHAIGDEV